MKRTRSISGIALVLMLAGSGVQVRADNDLVWVTGKVTDSRNKPLVNTLVAAYDDNNKVVDYARTDANGEYALALSRKAIHMENKRTSFITTVVGGITRFVGGAAGFIANPLRAGVSAVTSSQAANMTDPLTRGGIAAGSLVADQLLFRISPPKKVTIFEERKQPGAIVIKAVSPDNHDLIAVGRVYWVQEEKFKAGGKESKTLAVWLDPIQMKPASGSEVSRIGSDYLTFAAARIVPGIVEAGETVRVTVSIPKPPSPETFLTVIARNNRTGQIWELKLVGNDQYTTDILVDKRFPKDDQVISVLAYAAQPYEEKRRKEVESAIERAGLWDIHKPFVFNPLLTVSRNRADLTLTVVGDKK